MSKVSKTVNYYFISGFSQPASTLEILGEKLKAKNKIYTSPSELYPNYVAKLESLIKEKATKEKATIVAWSMGASIALDYAVNNSEKIDKLILISATSNYIKTKDNDIGVDIDKLNALKNGIISSREITLKRFISKFSKKDSSKFLKNALEQNKEVLAHNLDYFTRDNTKNAKGIESKALIFHDKDDRIVPFSHGQKLKSLISNSELFTSSNYGHILEPENSKIIANIIKNHK